MGYELHIVRQNNYAENEEESNISMEEWLDYVASDKELKLTNGYRLDIPGMETTWQDSPGFTEWLVHPRREDNSLVWFDFGCGSISAKFPDDNTIKKMIEISKGLDAKVRGDDFEYYDESYLTEGVHFVDDAQSVNNLQQNMEITKKPWWKFWRFLLIV